MCCSGISWCSRHELPAAIEMSLAGASLVTFVVLAALAFTHYPHLKSAAWINGGQGIILFSAGVVTFLYKCREGKAKQLKEEKALFIQETVQHLIIRDVLVKILENKKWPAVSLSLSSMQTLFSTDQKETYVKVGNQIYPTIADNSLSSDAIALTAVQKKQLKNDLRLNDDQSFLLNPFQISTILPASISDAVNVEVLVTNTPSLTANLQSELNLLLKGCIFQNSQKMQLKMNGLQIEVTLSSAVSSEYFRVTEKTEKEFKTEKNEKKNEKKKDEKEEVNRETEKDLTVVERLEKKGVAGLPSALNDIFQPIIDIQNESHKKTYEKWGKKPDRGILLIGPPGTGKTSIAKHIGQILGCREKDIKIINGADLLGSLVGETEKNINKLFEAPEGCSFFMIIMDEADSFLHKRKEDDQSWETLSVSQFLVQLDGIATRDNFLFVAMTNRPEEIDPAFLRPGRLSQKIEIGLPNAVTRGKIFQVYLEDLTKRNLIDKIDFKELIESTEGYSGAEIKQSVDLSKNRPLKAELKGNQEAKLTMDDLRIAIKQVNELKKIGKTEKKSFLQRCGEKVALFVNGICSFCSHR